MYYTICRLKNRFIFRGFERGVFSGLFAYTIFIAINSVVDQINWNIDKVLLGRFKGTASVAVYSVGYSLYAYYMTFSTSISSVFTPRIHKIVLGTAEHLDAQRQQLTELFVKVGRIQFLLLGLLASGMVFFGTPFITVYWAGSGYDESYYVALLLTIPATIALIQNVGIEIQRAENRHWFRSVAYFIMAIINLFLSIYLCQLYGAVGSAIGTAISLIAGNGIIMNFYYHTRCNINVLTFWRNILSEGKGLILPIAVGVMILTFLDLNKPIVMVFGILVYVIIYAVSIWFLSMNDYERDIFRKPVTKMLRRGARK